MQRFNNRERREGGNRRDNRLDKEGRKKRRKVCQFCANKVNPDYKSVDIMRRFITERGKIMTQRSSGCCTKHQRALATQIKRGRQIGFLPYTAD